MGLFSFIESAGRKLGFFGDRKAKEAEAAKEAAKEAASTGEAIAADIHAAILSYVAIDDLLVTFEVGTVQLSGTATSQADAERAVLVAGNTEGVSQVDDGGLVVREPEPPSVHHTVVKGDTLSELAGEYYGVIRLFDAIFEANQPMLAHPDEIYPGQVLRIPPVRTPTHTVARGETLGTIAKHWYGDAKRYRTIFEANGSVLSNPDEVEIGQELTIPLVDPKVPALS